MRAFMSGRVPVVPGTAGELPSKQPMPDCVACGYGTYNGVLRSWQIVGGSQLALCVDWQACLGRFR
jgi:hypothetical protein